MPQQSSLPWVVRPREGLCEWGSVFSSASETASPSQYGKPLGGCIRGAEQSRSPRGKSKIRPMHEAASLPPRGGASQGGEGFYEYVVTVRPRKVPDTGSHSGNMANGPISSASRRGTERGRIRILSHLISEHGWLTMTAGRGMGVTGTEGVAPSGGASEGRSGVLADGHNVAAHWRSAGRAGSASQEGAVRGHIDSASQRDVVRFRSEDPPAQLSQSFAHHSSMVTSDALSPVLFPVVSALVLDVRFSDKDTKLLKTQRFSKIFDKPVDMKKVKKELIYPWIARRVTELLGVEDEVLINFIFSLLQDEVDPKRMQIQLTGFLENHTTTFMKELWKILRNAHHNEHGIPQKLLDEFAEENGLIPTEVGDARKKALEAAARLSSDILEESQKERGTKEDHEVPTIDGDAELQRSNRSNHFHAQDEDWKRKRSHSAVERRDFNAHKRRRFSNHHGNRYNHGDRFPLNNTLRFGRSSDSHQQPQWHRNLRRNSCNPRQSWSSGKAYKREGAARSFRGNNSNRTASMTSYPPGFNCSRNGTDSLAELSVNIERQKTYPPGFEKKINSELHDIQDTQQPQSPPPGFHCRREWRSHIQLRSFKRPSSPQFSRKSQPEARLDKFYKSPDQQDSSRQVEDMDISSEDESCVKKSMMDSAGSAGECEGMETRDERKARKMERRRLKEEKRARKEERRKRREEKRQRKAEKQAAREASKKAESGGDHPDDWVPLPIMEPEAMKQDAEIQICSQEFEERDRRWLDTVLLDGPADISQTEDPDWVSMPKLAAAGKTVMESQEYHKTITGDEQRKADLERDLRMKVMHSFQARRLTVGDAGCQ
ncbi:unnamed protein product [Closterium sp. NIES-64]|nr:unnamed protein product [Closterium sp. NIES-64]